MFNKLEITGIHKKNVRVNPTQLAILESIFAQNEFPKIELRRKLAAEIGLSERNVQIWFQNRRVRDKSAEKRHLKKLLVQQETQARKAFTTSLNRQELQKEKLSLADISPLSSSENTVLSGKIQFTPHPDLFNQNGGQHSLSASIHSFSCIELNIGNWKRITAKDPTLLCQFIPHEQALVWSFKESSIHFKMVLDTSAILKVSIKDSSPSISILTFHTLYSPRFYALTKEWVECVDFTPNNDASFTREHQISIPSILADIEIGKFFMAIGNLASNIIFDDRRQIIQSKLPEITQSMRNTSFSTLLDMETLTQGHEIPELTFIDSIPEEKISFENQNTLEYLLSLIE